jgi:hypothetical protein
MKTIRIYYEELGGHTHMSVWSGGNGASMGKSGELVMTNEEFKDWKSGYANVEFVERIAVKLTRNDEAVTG